MDSAILQESFQFVFLAGKWFRQVHLDFNIIRSVSHVYVVLGHLLRTMFSGRLSNGEKERIMNSSVLLLSVSVSVQSGYLQLSVTRDGLSSSCSCSGKGVYPSSSGSGSMSDVKSSGSAVSWANLCSQCLSLRVDVFPRSIQVRVVELPLVQFVQV